MRIGRKAVGNDPEANNNALIRFTRNITEEAINGKIDPVIGRDEEIRRTLQVLARRTKNNSVLIGEPGVGKTAIVKGQKKSIFAGYLIRINYFKDRISGDYLNYFMNSHTAKQYGNKVKSFGVNQSNINGTKLKSYPFHFTTK